MLWRVFVMVVFPVFCFGMQVDPSSAVDTVHRKELDGVIVTGTRTQRDILTLPLPAQVITGESIRSRGMSRLSEIIQEQTGLVMVPDFGGGEGVQLQGLDAAYVMILIDGEPLFGRKAGTLDLNRITALHIDRIEIVKGASSGLYGSEALAGVVNIITNKVAFNNKVSGTGNYKYGSFGTHDASASLQWAKQSWGADLFVNYFKTNGYNLSEDTFSQTVEPYQNVTVEPKIRAKISRNLDAILKSRLFHQVQDYKTRVNNVPYRGESSIREWNHSLLLNHSISNRLKWSYDIYTTLYTSKEYLNNSEGMLFDRSYFRQWYIRPEVRSHYVIGKNTLTTGIGLNYENLNRTYFEKQEMLNSEYIFGQYEWFKGRWNILSGFRYDHHHQYQSQWSPKLGVNYTISPSLSVKTSLGYGYKAPDLRQLYLDFTNSSIGYTVLGYNVAQEKLSSLEREQQILSSNHLDFSQALKPESSINFNLGSNYRLQKLSFDFNFFHNTIHNLIETRAIAQKNNGQNVFSYFNIGKIFTSGLEFNSSYAFSESISLSMGYQYLIAKDSQTIKELNKGHIFARNTKTHSTFKLQVGDYFGLFNRSKHHANLKVNYTHTKAKASLHTRLLYRSKFGLFDSNNNQILDNYDVFVKGYFLTNVTVNKWFKSDFTVQLGVNNLFDYKDNTNIPNLPGRQIFARVNYDF